MSSGTNTRDATATHQTRGMGARYVPTSPTAVLGTSADRADRIRSPERRRSTSAPAYADSKPMQASDGDDATKAHRASKPSPRRIKRTGIREAQSEEGQRERTPASGSISRRRSPRGAHKVAPRADPPLTTAADLSAQARHKPRILCTNNALDRRLIANGGSRPLGSNHQCFQRGVGAGLHHMPEDMEHFLQSFSGDYKKLVEQPLYFGDGPVPPGKIRATRPQCVNKGFGVGQMLKAKRILAERKKKLLTRPLE